MLKKGSDRKKFEPGGDEEQFNDELQGFRRNQDSQDQIVEETMWHPTQRLAEQGHDVSYDEAPSSTSDCLLRNAC